MPFLKRIHLSPREYMDLKNELVKGTQLEKGKETCFGSLSWCCKDSSPCMFRDMVLKEQKIPMARYMKMKQELSEKILDYVFSKDEIPDES